MPDTVLLMSEKITVDLQVTVTVNDVEKLRQAGAYRYQEGGVGEVHTLLPDFEDTQRLAAHYFSMKLMDAAGDQDLFSDPSTVAS